MMRMQKQGRKSMLRTGGGVNNLQYTDTDRSLIFSVA